MDAIDIIELTGERFSKALEMFPIGQPIRYQGVAMWLGPEGHLECEIESSWAPENVTPESAHDDLARASTVVGIFTAASEVFASVAGSLPRREYLVYPYGKGRVEIARREGGVVTWAVWLPSPTATDPRTLQSSAWNLSADKLSPDSRYRAIIRDAQEFRMGSPTSGTLEVRETAPGDRLLLVMHSCSPAFIWSNHSDELAVPQYTHDLDQRLILASPITGRVRMVPESYTLFIPYSFNDGVIRGMDSPLYASRPVEVVINEVAQDAGDRPMDIHTFVKGFRE
jgi:hypothetical protein